MRQLDKVEAKGGGDLPEDVRTGLAWCVPPHKLAASDKERGVGGTDWKSAARVLIHLLDDGPHG